MGYAPNYLARGLSSGRTCNLGVVGFGLEYFGPANVLTGIERKAKEFGYSVLLALIDSFDKESVEQVLTQFIAQQVAGIIWAIPGFTDSMELIRKETEDLQVPIVLLNRDLIKSRIVISMDNRAGGRMATRHLFEQGYKKVGIITGPSTWWEACERLTGWREVMNEMGILDLDRLVFEGDWGVDSGDCGFEALYAANPDLDAIFVSNDQMSLGVIQAAHRRGLKIPDNLGIVGFDNIPESKFFFPPLTTIHQPAQELGGLAVMHLDQCIQAGMDGECIQEEENLIHPAVDHPPEFVQERPLDYLKVVKNIISCIFPVNSTNII